MAENLSGKVIQGRYRLEERLGEGATGEVYRATQISVDRKVAIKFLHPFLQETSTFAERFKIEAKAMARLSHPHILGIHDYGFDDGSGLFFMVVEFVEGYSLSDKLKEGKPATDFTLRVVYQVAEALESAHRNNILHRDLKPENIMISTLSPRPVAKVLDFGLAQLFDDESEDLTATQRRKRLTQTGEIYGTPAYMSPEQCRGVHELGVESDLYSLGVILYEMLEGKLPFYNQIPTAVMLQHMNDPIPPMTADLDDELLMLVEWMLNKDPADRPRGAGQVLDVLRNHIILDMSQELRMPDADRAGAIRHMNDNSGSWSRERFMPPISEILESEDPSFIELASGPEKTTNWGVVIGSSLAFLLIGAVLGFFAGLNVENDKELVSDVPSPSEAEIAVAEPTEPDPVAEPEPEEVPEHADSAERDGLDRAILIAASATGLSQQAGAGKNSERKSKSKRRKKSKRRR